MRHDSQSPLLVPVPDFPAHPLVGAHSLLDPPHEGPLPGSRQGDWFGRLADLPPVTDYEPNDFIEENNSEVAPTPFQCGVLLRHITLVMTMQLRPWTPRSTMGRLSVWCCKMYTQEREASANQPRINHSGKGKFWTKLIIV